MKPIVVTLTADDDDWIRGDYVGARAVIAAIRAAAKPGARGITNH